MQARPVCQEPFCLACQVMQRAPRRVQAWARPSRPDRNNGPAPTASLRPAAPVPGTPGLGKLTGREVKAPEIRTANQPARALTTGTSRYGRTSSRLAGRGARPVCRSIGRLRAFATSTPQADGIAKEAKEPRAMEKFRQRSSPQETRAKGPGPKPQPQTTLGRAGAESGPAGPCPCAKIKTSRFQTDPMDFVRHRLAAGA